MNPQSQRDRTLEIVAVILIFFGARWMTASAIPTVKPYVGLAMVIVAVLVFAILSFRRPGNTSGGILLLLLLSNFIQQPIWEGVSWQQHVQFFSLAGVLLIGPLLYLLRPGRQQKTSGDAPS